MNTSPESPLSPSDFAAIPRRGFSNARLVVIGDLMLDRYISGDVSRISPEAPVPVLAVGTRRASAGGAANVALNAAGLRAHVTLIGAVGRDDAARELSDILRAKGLDTSGLIPAPDRPTTSKTRVVCGNHQIVRMDEELATPLPSAAARDLLHAALTALENTCHALLLSDYAKGVLTPELIRQLIQAADARGVPVLVDPKRSDYAPYAGAACITPNFKEFKEAARAFSLDDQQPIAALGLQLLERTRAGALLVTQGAEGMTLFTRHQSFHSPALAEEVFDVSGAGDTVIATVAAALASGLDLLTAVRLSNVAASLVVRRSGTAPVDWTDLEQRLFQSSTPAPADPAFNLQP